MLTRVKRGWEIPERLATPEHIFHARRQIVKGIAAGPILAALPLVAKSAWAQTEDKDPSAGLYPVDQNPRYTLDRPITPEKVSTTYNNFYEFGSHKQISQSAQDLRIRPWEVHFDGLVEQEKTVGIDDLLAAMPLEERLYRHRCVEAWSMDVPWSGFEMKALVEFAKPLGSAKYVQMQTFHDKDMAPGQRQFWYPWPYTEGVSMAEATNELAFMVTGMYGKPVPKQNGAPLRIALPWKYGFKSIKSIVRFSFVEERPKSFWEELAANEYGFWANVNPEVPHPRWSQASERNIGLDEKVPTRLYNGYGEFVADLYTNMKDELLFM
ncbi:MAG: protein-methionine-sulfoxide reductase catalytic subunit MsrP [Alphaproteobacteria bacterium]|nr:protein-methionine-sulfoxide reductase catalytic subunit MsrP [Alphaproteobacteria bacterium]